MGPEQIKEILKYVQNPLTHKDIVTDGTLVKIEQKEGMPIELTLATGDDRRLQLALDSQIRTAFAKANLNAQEIKFIFAARENKPKTSPSFAVVQKVPGVQYILAVGSGKGGVGKSTVSVNLAAMLQLLNQRVGILDADIYGPSIGKMLGLEGRQNVLVKENTIIPVERFGLKVMSFSFLIEENQAVVWRGPMLGKAIQQFLYDVAWAPLDFLIVDLPPGTGDAQLSLAQQVQSDGAIVVTTPQNVALLDAGRALSMFEQVHIPILGIIENMSEFICPHCKKSSHIFSSGGGKKLAKKADVPLLGQIPLTVELMESAEKGFPLVTKDKKGPVFLAFEEIAKKIVQSLQENAT